VSRTFRDAVLDLAKKHAFARKLVNSGRLSVPAILRESPLNTRDRDTDFSVANGAMIPGAPAADAPVRGPLPGANGEWLLGYLGGSFTLLGFGDAVGPHGVAALARDRIACKVVHVGGKPVIGATQVDDVEGLAARRYDARPGTVYLLRPDQHVCARWREFDLPSVRAAIARATCND
jgi:3-(3-hydroxy-phenyl)propionate hydroxylase